MQLTSGSFQSSSRGSAQRFGVALTTSSTSSVLNPFPPARALGNTPALRLLGRRLQGVLLLSVFCAAFVVFDFSFFSAEFVMSPLGAGARLSEHEAASSSGEGSPATASVHPLVRAFALPVIVLQGSRTKTAGETPTTRDPTARVRP